MCPVENCWQPVKAAGLCGACYSWWNRIKFKDAPQLAEYLQRLNRFSGRAGRIAPAVRKHGGGDRIRLVKTTNGYRHSRKAA